MEVDTALRRKCLTSRLTSLYHLSLGLSRLLLSVQTNLMSLYPVNLIQSAYKLEYKYYVTVEHLRKDTHLWLVLVSMCLVESSRMMHVTESEVRSEWNFLGLEGK